MKKPLLILFLTINTALVFGQSKVITGKITSDDNFPLPGVSVVVKGTSIGTQSNAQGTFSLTVPASAARLVFSFIGYKQQEKTITGSTINVTMTADLAVLNEVVITGYQTQTKRQTTGSVAIVRGEDVSATPIASFDQALQGKVPGVLVGSQSGQPGAAATVLIRGRGSVLGAVQPLYIVDGVEISGGDFATLNSNDFDSYSVLKDAVSTAQYGSRGSNGVIVITTKKGKQGKMRVTYDGQLGKSKAPSNKLKLMNTDQKLDYEIANGNPNGWSDAEIAALRLVHTDWEKVFFRTGTTDSHNLSLSGATDKTNYFVSGNYFDQTGTVITTKLKRYSGRANVGGSTKDFDFGLNSSFGYSAYSNTPENNSTISSPLNAIRWSNPYLAPYDANGNYSVNPTGQPNPLPELLENRNLRGQLKGVGNIFGVYRIPFVQGLSLKASAGGDYTSNETNNFVDPSTSGGTAATGGKGSVTRGYAKTFRYTVTNSLNYTKTFGDHHITAALYNEIVKSNNTSFSYTGYGLGGAFENESGITPGTATNGFIPAVAGSGTANALLSYFATVNYGFKDRYFLESTVRRDGSSRFGANKKYANFGSIGGSWIVSDENFMSEFKSTWLNELKLKASYGSAGNQAGIGDFEAREIYGRSFYNGAAGLVQTQLAKPDLQWERKTTFNIGMEFTAIKSRISGSVEYYKAITSDLFLNRQLSRTTGYTSINSNIGSLQNAGVEVTLNGDVFKSKDFRWNLYGNFTYNKNKIRKLVGDQKEIISGLNITRIGESINTLYVNRYVGVNPANGNAQYLTKDGAVTETFSAADRVIVGSSEVPYYGGFGSLVNFKGIELSAFFSYSVGNKIYNNDRSNVEIPDYLVDNVSADLATEWRKPGDITNIPRASQAIQTATTRFVESGNFVRLRNCSVSYSLPKTLLSAAKINSVKIFVQGENLVTWTQFRGADPELPQGLTGAQYPALRTITAGINIGL